jgi:dTDP-glucose 4,6-dehydratase
MDAIASTFRLNLVKSSIIKIAVIGSNSFSGASFVDFALTNNLSVMGISRSEQPNDIFLPYSNNTHKEERFKFHQLDLNNNLDEMINLIKKEEPDYIFNFAAQSMVAESWEFPEQWFTTNAVSMTKLFNELKDCSFLKKYIHVTTPEVYGSCSGYITEDMTYNPSTPYAASRAAGDMSLKTFVDNYNFPAVSTRAANVFGPGQQLYRIIPRTILYIRQGKKLQLHGGGYSERSFIHINDVSDATLKIALDGVIGDTYHISTESTITIRALVQLICDKMNVKFEDYVDIVDDRPGKDVAYLLDSSKLRNDFGWEDKINLDEGLKETLSWVDKNLECLSSLPSEYIHKM